MDSIYNLQVWLLSGVSGFDSSSLLKTFIDFKKISITFGIIYLWIKMTFSALLSSFNGVLCSNITYPPFLNFLALWTETSTSICLELKSLNCCIRSSNSFTGLGFLDIICLLRWWFFHWCRRLSFWCWRCDGQ